MKQKIIMTFFVFFSLFLWQSKPVLAARTRVRKPAQTGGPVAYQPSGVGVKVRFRPDRRALLISFSNFDRIESGSYQLVYTAGGVQQGAGGSIMLGDSGEKTLLFGTCSGGVCTYHSGIQNARLSVTSVLPNGQTVLKPFRIRV